MSGPRLGVRDVVELWDGRNWACDGWYCGAPVFRYRWAPSGLATVRQLRAIGLRPGGQEPAAYLAGGEQRWAYLYRVDLAKPQYQSEAKRAAMRAVNLRRRTCPGCGGVMPYRIPRELGRCWPCAQPDQQRGTAA